MSLKHLDPGPGAYDTLVAAAWNEETEHFVATDTLLGSWRVWSPLLREMDALETAPPAYGPGGAAAYARASRLFRDAPKEL